MWTWLPSLVWRALEVLFVVVVVEV
jgi:hypothetical protein